jgi:hypothetical protein
MKVTDETIGAFVDGELDDADVEALLREAARDQALANEIERQRRLRARLRAAHADVLEEQPPARLVRLLAEPSRPTGRPLLRRSSVRAAGAGFALAASLALAVGLSLHFRGQGDVGFAAGGQATAQGELARALDRQLGTEAAGARSPVRLIASFKAEDGRYCRLFQTRSTRAATGLACKEGGAWTIAALAAARPAQSTAYRQAGSALPQAVVDAMDEVGAVAPLSAADERAAEQSGWTTGTARP